MPPAVSRLECLTPTCSAAVLPLFVSAQQSWPHPTSRTVRSTNQRRRRTRPTGARAATRRRTMLLSQSANPAKSLAWSLGPTVIRSTLPATRLPTLSVCRKRKQEPASNVALRTNQNQKQPAMPTLTAMPMATALHTARKGARGGLLSHGSARASATPTTTPNGRSTWGLL